MVYYRNRRYNSYYSRSFYSLQKSTSLREESAEDQAARWAAEEISESAKRRLLNLYAFMNYAEREDFWEEFKNTYGKGKARYAKETMDSWCDGSISPKNVSVGRILALLPKYIPGPERRDFMKLLVEEHVKYHGHFNTKDYRKEGIGINIQDDLVQRTQKIDFAKKAFNELSQFPPIQPDLSSWLTSVATWLNDPEGLALRGILMEYRNREAKLMVEDAKERFNWLISQAANPRDLNFNHSEDFKLPSGTFTLNVYSSKSEPLGCSTIIGIAFFIFILLILFH